MRRYAVIGAGPAGLLFSALIRRHDPECSVTVFEKHPASRETGFGIVFPTDALRALTAADESIGQSLARHALRWEDFEVHHRSAIGGVRSTTRVRWRPSLAVSRAAVLEVLTVRCQELGVDLRFGTPAPPLNQLRADHDLVVAADGAGSPTRKALAAEFGVTERAGRCRYLWLDTDAPLSAFHFDFVNTPEGLIQTHAYPYGPASTLVVEMREEVYERLRPGPEECAEYWAELLQGSPVRTAPGQRDWRTFRTVHCERWSHGNVALIGDAAHTTHFSIGAGTKLAMGDATALAERVAGTSDLTAALRSYQDRRRAPVSRASAAAVASQRWLEEAAGETTASPSLFAFKVLSRSKRMTRERIRQHDPAYVSMTERAFAGKAQQAPWETPIRLGGVTLPNRIAAEAPAVTQNLVSPPGLLMVALEDRRAEHPTGVVGARLRASADNIAERAAALARSAVRAECLGFRLLELECFGESSELFAMTETVRSATDLPLMVRIRATDDDDLEGLVCVIQQAGGDAISVLPEDRWSNALPTQRYGRWDFVGNAMAVRRAAQRASQPALPVVAIGENRSADDIGTALLAGYTDLWLVRG